MFSLFQRKFQGYFIFIIQFIEFNLRHYVSNVEVISCIVSQCSWLMKIVPIRVATSRAYYKLSFVDPGFRNKIVLF